LRLKAKLVRDKSSRVRTTNCAKFLSVRVNLEANWRELELTKGSQVLPSTRNFSIVF